MSPRSALRSTLALGFIFMVVDSAPLLDILADPCTGSVEPAVSVSGVCYSGKVSILAGTWHEEVLLEILQYDSSSGKGMVKLDAEGASPQHCPKTKFTKSPGKQQLEVDFGRCLSGATVEALYCSDQNSILVHVGVPNKHVPTVPVTLKTTPCPEKPARAGNVSGGKVHPNEKRRLSLEAFLIEAGKSLGIQVDKGALATIQGMREEDADAGAEEEEDEEEAEAQGAQKASLDDEPDV